jgi:hypothetical protein
MSGTNPVRAMQLAAEKLVESEVWLREALSGSRSAALSGALTGLAGQACQLRQKVEDLREAQTPVRSPPSDGRPSMLAVVLLLALLPSMLQAGERRDPPVPGPLQVPGKILEDAELILQERAGFPQRQPFAIRQFINDHLDPTTKAGRDRTVRLARGPDDQGVVCFVAEGLRYLSLSLAVTAADGGLPVLARTLRGNAAYLETFIVQRCGGPGGQQAMREWQSISSAMGRRGGDLLHRVAATPCQPVPHPLVTACAPTRAEVHIPKDAGEWLLTAAGFAAGFGVPALVARGLTWAELFAAGSVAVPAVAGGR